tara:strand:+ start:31 stop:1152 length:1122 start_codon:yes stop_codon:yes gene_type:complete
MVKKSDTKEYKFIKKGMIERKPDTSEKTQEAYTHLVYHLYKDLEERSCANLNNFLFGIYDPCFDAIYKKIILEEVHNHNTKRNKLSALQSWFGENTPNWIISLRDDLNDKYNKETITDPKPLKCSWKDIMSISRRIDLECKNQKLRSRIRNLELLPLPQKRLFIENAIWRLYTEAPLRNDFNLYVNPTNHHPNHLGEYYNFDPKKKNWYTPSRKEIVINEFKTNKTYEAITITPSKQLQNDFASIYALNKRVNPNAFFILLFCCADIPADNDEEICRKAKHKIATKNDISRFLFHISKKYGKKQIGIRSSDIRHIYLTEKYAKTKKDQQDDAKLMGHSVGCQQNIYVAKPITELVFGVSGTLTKIQNFDEELE